MAETIHVELVWGEPDTQILLALDVAEGTTLLEAIEQSGIQEQNTKIEIDAARLGVFSRKKSPDYILREGDRIEIYRPLIADPKEIRRKRAAEQN